MLAIDLIYPRPLLVTTLADTDSHPTAIALPADSLPDVLHERLALACKRADIALTQDRGTPLQIKQAPVAITGVSDPALLREAYVLSATQDRLHLQASGPEGIRHGIVTLCLLLEAAGQGATLHALTIHDAPAFAVRGVQIDMAREFFPPLAYLRKVIDRLVDLKANTLWLYIENHLRVPGMDDISQRDGLSIEQAQAISAYGRQRGIDVVPGTNVLSHMEGWYRLERHAAHSDGSMRSYPVLTDPRTWPLVQRYLDAMMEAFPSVNFHAGLDELLFTGTNPKAQEAIDATDKPTYFADFACRVIDYLKGKGKTVWIWDDMVMGKNVYRKEGFNDDYVKALERIDEDVVMTHWYYWTDSDGMHGPIMKRVAEAKRPFVVAPAAQAFSYTCPQYTVAAENQSYMAACGLAHGAFGLINTHWESRYGTAFAMTWPHLAMGCGYAWSGPGDFESQRDAFGFVLTGDSNGALGGWLTATSALDKLFDEELKLGGSGFRSLLFLKGPHQLWRQLSPVLTAEHNVIARAWIEKAWQHHAALGDRDSEMAHHLALPIRLFEIGLQIVDAFNRAWDAWHQAAKVEREPDSHEAFHHHLARAVGFVADASRLTRQLQQYYVQVQATGHTAYDSYALGQWVAELDRVCDLMLDAAYDGGGLPYFEKLLYLRDAYHCSNLRQLQVQNTFHERFTRLPWLARQDDTPQPT